MAGRGTDIRRRSAGARAEGADCVSSPPKRHNSRRIDRQLFGRTARPGRSRQLSRGAVAGGRRQWATICRRRCAGWHRCRSVSATPSCGWPSCRRAAPAEQSAPTDPPRARMDRQPPLPRPAVGRNALSVGRCRGRCREARRARPSRAASDGMRRSPRGDSEPPRGGLRAVGQGRAALELVGEEAAAGTGPARA